MSEINIFSSVRVGGGYLKRVQHFSESTGTNMTFGIFLPSSVSAASEITPSPALFWLSGLTCDDTNFETKAGPKAFDAAEKAVSVVFDERQKLCLRVYVYMNESSDWW